MARTQRGTANTELIRTACRCRHLATVPRSINPRPRGEGDQSTPAQHASAASALTLLRLPAEPDRTTSAARSAHTRHSGIRTGQVKEIARLRPVQANNRNAPQAASATTRRTQPPVFTPPLRFLPDPIAVRNLPWIEERDLLGAKCPASQLPAESLASPPRRRKPHTHRAARLKVRGSSSQQLARASAPLPRPANHHLGLPHTRDKPRRRLR